MNRPSIANLSISFILASALAASAQPALGEVKSVLCAADAIDRCDEADYSPPMAIDVNADGTREWIFVLARGGDELCHVRHACFTILQQHRGGWRVLLRGMGGSVGTRGARGYRDLVVLSANGADEHEHVVHRFRNGSYRRVSQRTCGLDDSAALCRQPDGEVILQ